MLLLRLILLHACIFSFTILSGNLLAGSKFKGKYFNQTKRHYGYIYWENGSPQKKISRRPKSWVNPEMAKNPDVVFQTGFYNVRFETDSLRFSGYEASPGSDYLAALTEDVTFLPDRDAELILKAWVVEGDELIEYTATSAIVETDTQLNVRLIENGRFIQRIDHKGLVFVNASGDVLPESGNFEITAWPNQMTLTLDFSKTSLSVAGLAIRLYTPDGKTHSITENKSKIGLPIEPQTDSRIADPTFAVTGAYERGTNIPLNVEFDHDYHAFRLDVPIKNEADHHRVDEFVFELNNPSSESQEIPIVFNQVGGFKSITGNVMLLTELDGHPSGIPVQISKNWHKTHSDKHAGNWLRGTTIIHVQANSSRKLSLKVLNGYWDHAATASHSQLSLIGWNKYSWKWDQSALGAWGESMTFDPGQTVAGTFIADVRPTFTTPTKSSSDHGWTENVGGGDFLKYFDHKKKYRWAKKLKTAYHWTGPNMTEVLYSGVTDDDSIKFVYKTQLFRGNDYHRRINSFKYQFLKDVQPKRIVFYQTAADYYLLPQFVSAYWGGADYSNKITPCHGGNLYTAKFPFNNQWIAIEDLITGKDTTKSNRGIIWRKSKLNGLDFDLYAHVYGRTWGRDTSLFDISGESTNQAYYAGNVIEGEIEYIMPAKSKKYYWGSDSHFYSRLSQYTKPWMLTEQEFVYNNFNALVTGAIVNNQYPIDVDANVGNLDVHIIIPESKGVGHIPVILRNVDPGKVIYAHVFEDGEWNPAAKTYSNYLNHSYYQAYLNASGSKDYVFNIIRPESLPFEESLKIRITEERLYDEF